MGIPDDLDPLFGFGDFWLIENDASTAQRIGMKIVRVAEVHDIVDIQLIAATA